MHRSMTPTFVGAGTLNVAAKTIVDVAQLALAGSPVDPIGELTSHLDYALASFNSDQEDGYFLESHLEENMFANFLELRGLTAKGLEPEPELVMDMVSTMFSALTATGDTDQFTSTQHLERLV